MLQTKLTNNILKKKPSVPAALERAQILHQNGKFKESIELYKNILKDQPTCAEAAFAISVLYNDLGRYQKAQIYFKKATQAKKNKQLSVTPLKNEVIQKYQELAEIYSKYKQPQVAIKYQLTALALSPKDKNIFISLGKNLIQLGQYNKAISIFKYLNNQDPGSYIIQFRLAHAYYRNKQTLHAVIIWQNLAKQFPYKKEVRMLNYLTQTLRAI
ncbi:MAG: tetratricopeptide repeat protein [Bdellovibrionales bacterium]|nr:tetratricopeptide repeat protein [Bdellovibrionales bacterium]